MTTTTSGALTREQLDQFHRDGYLLLPNFFDPAEPLAQARHLVKNFSLEDHPLTKFTNDLDDDRHARYFLESGDKVRYFFEEGALGEDGQLNRPKDQVRACEIVTHESLCADPSSLIARRSTKLAMLSTPTTQSFTASPSLRDCRTLLAPSTLIEIPASCSRWSSASPQR